MSLAAARMDELFTRVVGPLVIGGRLAPPRPIGAGLAEEIAELSDVFQPSDDLFARAVHAQRATQARALWPVDALPPLGPSEWRLACVLSDLVQAANPELGGLWGGGRHARLLASIEATLERVPPVETPLDALARHATFARVPELGRVDASVSWWTGSATFRGQTPPPRLLAWPRARRVSVHEHRVSLAELSSHLADVQSRWLAAVAIFFEKTPLTDLSRDPRAEPSSRAEKAVERLSATRAGSLLVARVRAERDAARRREGPSKRAG